jgi:hypothetical protein
MMKKGRCIVDILYDEENRTFARHIEGYYYIHRTIGNCDEIFYARFGAEDICLNKKQVMQIFQKAVSFV